MLDIYQPKSIKTGKMIQIGYKKTPKNPKRNTSAQFVIKPINTHQGYIDIRKVV
jgi:hypothetical protein